MNRDAFLSLLTAHQTQLEAIRQRAHILHAEVNQTYDKVHPYGYHLDMVAQGVKDYGHAVLANDEDLLPLFMGAWFHDSIEDARLTYNDVLREAKNLELTEAQAYTAAEIVFALTNDKGRTREDRAGENYYKGIRETPYAPFVKLCDRMANATYSFTHGNPANSHMKEVYRREMPHFLEAIHSSNDDQRFMLPDEMLRKMENLLNS